MKPLGQVIPSANLGPRPELRWIDKNLIDVDKRYQREISVHGIRHINDILRNFEWRYFQVISVTPNKDRYNAIDGQHRWLATMKHPDIKDVPCLVLSKMDLQQQAKVFDIMNTKRLGVTSLAKYHAAVAAGDKTATWVDYICSEAGLTVLKTAPQGNALPPCSLVSVNTIAKFHRYQNSIIIAALTAAAEAWNNRPGAFRSANVTMLIRAAISLSADFDIKKFKRVLMGWNDHEEFLKSYTERAEHGGIITNILSERLIQRYRSAT